MVEEILEKLIDAYKNKNLNIEYAINELLDIILKQFPDNEFKHFVRQALRRVLENRLEPLLNGEIDLDTIMSETLEIATKKYAANKAKKISEAQIKEMLQKAEEHIQNKCKGKLQDNLEDSIGDTAEAFGNNLEMFINGEQNFEETLTNIVKENTARELQNRAAPHTKEALQKVYRMASGNKQGKLSNNAQSALDNTADKINNNFFKVFNGEQDFEDAVTNTGKEILTEEINKHAHDYMTKAARSTYRKVSGKQKGRLSNKVDSNINTLVNAAGENVLSVVNGEKDLGEAIVDTTKTTAIEVGKGYGKEIAVKAVKEIQKRTMKEIENKALKGVVKSGLDKLATADGVTGAVGIVIDVGTLIKQYADGKITEAQFLAALGEKGSAVCLGSIYGGIGSALGTMLLPGVGTVIGGAIGSMVGYIACNMLYGAVLDAFSAADRARDHYRMVSAMCEESIRLMRQQRAEFEAATEKLFKDRAQVMKVSFVKIENNMEKGDLDEFTEGLSMLAQEFGSELQFANFQEFENFMDSDDDLIL